MKTSLYQVPRDQGLILSYTLIPAVYHNQGITMLVNLQCITLHDRRWFLKLGYPNIHKFLQYRVPCGSKTGGGLCLSKIFTHHMVKDIVWDWYQ